MNYRHVVLLLFLVTGIAVSVYAEGLTVDEAISIALQKSTTIITSQKSLDSALLEYKNRGNLLYPSIQAGSTVNRSNTAPTVGMEELSPYSLSMSVQGSLRLSPATFDGIRVLEQDYEGAAIDREKAEKALRRDVKKSFYNLIYLEESISLLQESIETMEAQYKQALTDYQNGRVSELHMLNTKVAYKNMEPQLSSLHSNYRNALSRFCLLIGVDPNTELSLEGDIELPYSAAALQSAMDVDSKELSSGFNLSSRFDIRSTEVAIRQMETNRTGQVHSGFYPSMTISAGWNPVVREPFSDSTWSDSFSDQWTDQGSVSIGFSLPLDGLLPKSGVRTSIARLENSIESARAHYQQQLRSASSEVQTLYRDMNDSLSNIESLELNNEVAARNYELSEEAYRSGTQDFIALQQAEDELNTAKKNLLEEKLSFLEALFDLEYALNSSAEQILKGVIE